MPGGHRSAPDRAGRREGAEPYGLALDLSGCQPEKKLGKQRSVFPGRRSAEKVVSPGLGGEAGNLPSPPPAGAPPPKGEARLGSPFGGAVAVRRLRGQPASASTQPMRGGRWHLALSVLANASPPPPKGEARLGSPFGRAVAARRLRGQLASASTQPIRGSRWHLAHSVDKRHGTWYHRDRKREPAGKTAGPVYLLLRESSRFLGGAATFSCF